jgi:hypothetical protein
MPISTSGISVPQLGQTIDASIYGNQNAPKPMTIGDMLDISGKSLDIQKKKALLPSEIEVGQAAAKKAQADANTAQLENTSKHLTSIIQSQQKLLTKPDLTTDDIINTVKDHAKNIGTPDNVVQQSLAGLPQNASPTELRAFLAQNLTRSLSAQSQLEKLYPGGVLPNQLPAGGYQQAPAGSEMTPAPKGVTADQMNQPPKSEASSPVQLSYPVRQAGQAYTALPQEEDERKVGTATKSALFNRQSEIPQSQRTIDRVIEKARELEKSTTLPTSGFLGATERGLSTFLGTEQGIKYKELSKDLANAQIANITASGGSLNTDAGKQLVAMANGDVTYPPKVLIEIAHRTKADMAALDTKATAVKKFADKFGDQNISAFNQMWSKNADPDIFQLKNVFESDMSPEEKQKARDKIIGNDPKKAKLFMEKWNNIKKLEQTGTL